jgi:hypothetical protein
LPAWIGIVAVAWSASARAQNRAPSVTRTATIHWDQVPLADAVRRLAETFEVVVFFDRRADPTLRVSLDARNTNVTQALDRTAAAANLGVSQLGGVMYLGPRAAAERLRTLATLRGEEVGRLPAGLRTGLLEKRPLSWPRLAEPRALVAAAVTERGWQLAGETRIPHDAWAAGRLPQLSLADQLTLLLAGFDLTFRLVVANRTIEIVPFSEAVLVTRRYPLRYGEADAARLRQQFPTLAIEVTGNSAAVHARLEDHQRLAEWLAGPATRPTTRPPAGPAKSVFTLRVEEQSVQAVIDALKQKLDWKLEVDVEVIRAAGLSLDRRVSFEVKNADQDELLKALLQPAGLDYQREGERLKIVPLKEEER